MSGMPDSVRMICPEKACLNKSVVYRKISGSKIQLCKKCGAKLVKAGN